MDIKNRSIDDIPAVKGFNVETVQAELNRLKNENRALLKRLADRRNLDRLTGNSVQMQQVRDRIRLAAGTDVTILVTGESGVGKEVVARQIHELSDRSDGPFVKVCCSSIPALILESELFGASTNRDGSTAVAGGRLDPADGGTVLLDEIGGMSPAIQKKLLRVIEQRPTTRTGNGCVNKDNVRIIATTNLDLKEEIRKGRFLADLFYRLNVMPLEVPPLRERREDIPLLVDHFIEMFTSLNHREPVLLTEAAVEKLTNAYWKGNVRQLRNVIEQAVIMKGGTRLDAEYFHFEDERERQLTVVEQAFRFGTIRDMERLMIMNRLRDNGDNRTRSAETLDISVRTLRNKLNEYNVSSRRRHQPPGRQ